MPLVIPLLYLFTINFREVSYFPHGGFTPPLVFDSDHDACPELFIPSPFDTGTMVYRHIGNNQYVEIKLFDVNMRVIGYGDNDSFADAYGQSAPHGRGIGVWESRSLNGYPDTLVWNYPMADTEYAYAIGPANFVDFDQDGKMNLIAPVEYVDFFYFENLHDNYYTLIDSIWLPSGGGPWEMVVADFDNDSLLEMVGGDIDGKVYVWENAAIGVDSFQLVWTYRLPSGFGNAFYTAKGNDMDGDGKKEFIVGANAYNRWCFTMFETNGNNSYQKIWQYFYYYGGSLTSGDIDCGDIDGDGIDEMVTFGGLTLNVWKCVGPDSFVSIWDRWYMYDLTDGVLEIADLNQNGLGEIVVSGGNWGSTPPAKTYIYEKMPSVTWIYPARYDTLWANDTVNLLWKLDETVSLESLRIYIAHPLMGCWLIYQGLPTDTTCVFVVPDTQSNMAFKFWVAVQGYLRYDSIVSPPFYIKRRTGVEETAGRFTHDALRLEAQPNPFKGKLIIRYTIQDGGEMIQDTRYRIQDINLKIYDVSGRLVKSFNLESYIMYHESVISWDGTDDSGHRLPPGVYFVCLTNGSLSAIKKVIKFGR